MFLGYATIAPLEHHARETYESTKTREPKNMKRARDAPMKSQCISFPQLCIIRGHPNTSGNGSSNAWFAVQPIRSANLHANEISTTIGFQGRLDRKSSLFRVRRSHATGVPDREVERNDPRHPCRQPRSGRNRPSPICRFCSKSCIRPRFCCLQPQRGRENLGRHARLRIVCDASRGFSP